MIENILPNIYKIEVPLPKNPLKALNSYVLKASGRSLIIDTGMNRDECKEVMFSALKELNVDLGKTDFFITHLHADHSGLVSTLARDTSKIYCSQPDAEVINSPDVWKTVQDAARVNGFPEKELQNAIEKHPAYKYSPKGTIHFEIVKQGDNINIGDYQFQCVETPGHTKGHMCLYEPHQKVLVSGDHILDDITPNISQFSEEEGNPLQEYLESLDKVAQFNITIVLPGHRNMIKNCKGRIRELKQHHQTRLNEIISILKKSSGDAYFVASQMKWDINCEAWGAFPIPQKWFATGEAIAHLKYLEAQGKVKREIINQINVFSVA